MTKIENPFYSIKKEDMRNMSMNLADNVLKKEPNETKSLDFQSGTVKMEATERQEGITYSLQSKIIKKL